MPKEDNPRRNNLSKKGLWLGSAVLAAAAVLSACGQDGKESGPLSQTPAITPVATRFETATPSIQTPEVTKTPEVIQTPEATKHFWEEEQLAISFYDIETLLKYKNTINEEIPFYKGSKPLVFSSYQLPSSPQFGAYISLMYEFDEFMNFFVYKENILAGAQTYDENANLLAEASLEYSPTAEGSPRFFMEEVHYNTEGKIIFRASSEIISGVKTSEIKTEGKKENEYYFIWPDWPISP